VSDSITTIDNEERLPLPRVLRVEPASQCNLACSHCPTGTVNMQRGLMSDDVFSRVLEELKANKDSIKTVVLYHGGEPLLNRNFHKMVSEIKAIDDSLFIKTVSNGMALTRQQAEEIINGGMDAIEFSLDGISAQESQLVREKSDTRRVVSNIKNLLGLKSTRGLVKPKIYIATTQFVRDPNQVVKGDAAPVPDWLKKDFDGLGLDGFKPTYALRWPHMGKTIQYDSLKTSGPDLDECDNIINTITVRADGAVVPCCYDLTSKLVMGNIKDLPLVDIWNGRKYKDLRNSITTKKYISICSTCAVVRPKEYLIPKWEMPVSYRELIAVDTEFLGDEPESSG